MDWFEKLTGLRETTYTDTQAMLDVRDGTLFSSINGASYAIGELELVSLQTVVGALAIGDVAVAVAVAGSHRDEVFLACRYVIEELKGRVPIWKRETYSDGTVDWVDPTSPGAQHREAEVADR